MVAKPPSERMSPALPHLPQLTFPPGPAHAADLTSAICPALFFLDEVSAVLLCPICPLLLAGPLRTGAGPDCWKPGIPCHVPCRQRLQPPTQPLSSALWPGVSLTRVPREARGQGGLSASSHSPTFVFIFGPTLALLSSGRNVM